MRRFSLYLFLLILGLFSSLLVGRFVFLPVHMSPVERTILLDVRLPRVLSVALVGASLATAGLILQNVFRNPLAGPNVIGVTSGSAFGAVLAILAFGYNPTLVQLFAFLCGLFALAVVWSLRGALGGGLLGLVLVGMAVSAMFSSFIGLAKYLADPYDRLPAITFWLLGSFSGTRWEDVLAFAPVLLISVVGAMLLRWPLNLLSLGEEARGLGMDVDVYTKVSVGVAAVGIASSTALAGIVSWVGLLAPHMARLLVGHDNRILVPTTAITGSLLLLLCDDLARSLTPGELPLGVMTSFLGGPLLLLILSKNRWMFGRR